MSIEHLPVEIPGRGEVAQVAAGVWWIRMPLPFQLDHINLWAIEDGDGWTLVDTGFANDDTRACWETLLAGPLAGRSVRRLIVTHCHPDHLGLASWLVERLGVTVAISQGEYLTGQALVAGLQPYSREAMLDGFRRNGLGQAELEALGARGNAYKKGVPSLPERYHRLLEGDRVRIGAHAWRVMMGYGHSPEHAALYCADLGVLISGDMVLPRISTNVSISTASPEDDPLRMYLDSIARYATLPAETLVLPSHGRPFRGLRERVAALQAHHADRLEVLKAACDEPRCAAEVLQVLFQRTLDTHQIMFAMGEAIAHLNYLHHAGQLARETGADGVARFLATKT